MKATLERFEKVDISAQIAGVSQKQAPTEDLGEDEFDKVMKVNVKGGGSARSGGIDMHN